MTNFEAGLRNLLFACAGLRPGDRVLIVREPASEDYYDPALAGDACDGARSLGLEAKMLVRPFSPEASQPDAELESAMRAATCTLFLARLGDQIRFTEAMTHVRAIVCYAIDGTMMRSAFASVDYRAFVDLKKAVDHAFATAREIHVTCAEGTDFRGRMEPDFEPPKDTNTIRFPQSVYTPIPASGFSGVIAQRGFLVGTGSRYYSPYATEISETLMVSFEDNQIVGFEGSKADVTASRTHYEAIADQFAIDGSFVHSWHAGIHPACRFPDVASTNFQRWSGSAFGNPRLLHFHTCGAYAPGEICLNVVDPTIRIDGIAVWESGRLLPDRIQGGTAILDRTAGMRGIFDAPDPLCGLGADGRLSFD